MQSNNVLYTGAGQCVISEAQSKLRNSTLAHNLCPLCSVHLSKNSLKCNKNSSIATNICYCYESYQLEYGDDDDDDDYDDEDDDDGEF